MKGRMDHLEGMEERRRSGREKTRLDLTSVAAGPENRNGKGFKKCIFGRRKKSPQVQKLKEFECDAQTMELVGDEEPRVIIASARKTGKQ